MKFRNIRMETILVYQFGKVGSMSVYSAVKALENDHKKVYHIHRFYLSSGIEDASLRNIFKILRSRRTINKHIRMSESVKILTIVREPVARNISAFYQTLDPEAYDKSGIELMRSFFKKHSIHKTPMIWFDREMRRRFGIDVFTHQFDKELGYTIITKGEISLFLCTLEKLNGLYARLSEFLGVSGITEVSKNAGVNKSYSDSYKEFREHLIVPPHYIDTLYSSRYMKHFYNEDQIRGFRSIWLRPEDGNN